MTLDDLDTWRVIYSQFVGADSKSGISFALNSALEAQNSCKFRNITAEMSYGNGPWHPWPCVTDRRAAVYGSWISINTNYAVCNAKEHSRKQRNSPRYDRLQNPPISSEHDLIYDIITPWPVTSGNWNFQNICHINQWEGTESFVAVRRVLRELCTKNHGGSDRPHYKCEG